MTGGTTALELSTVAFLPFGLRTATTSFAFSEPVTFAEGRTGLAGKDSCRTPKDYAAAAECRTNHEEYKS